jgi:hypothetical protein
VLPIVCKDAFGSSKMTVTHAANQARANVFNDLFERTLVSTQSGTYPTIFCATLGLAPGAPDVASMMAV